MLVFGWQYSIGDPDAGNKEFLEKYVFPTFRGGWYALDLLSFVTPGPAHYASDFEIVKTINERIIKPPTPWEFAGYLGWANVAIVFFAFRRAIHKTAFYFYHLFFFFILSLGSYLHIYGNKLPILLPVRLTEFIPFLSSIRVPGRFIVFVYLFLGIIVAISLQKILQGKKRKNLFLLLLGMLIFFDFFAVCRETTKVYLPEGYHIIQKDLSEFAILDLPQNSWSANTSYMMFQAQHKLPIIAGAISRKFHSTLIDRLEWDNLSKQKKQLEKHHVKYIVFHKNLFPSQKELLLQLPKYQATYPVVFDDSHNIIFRVF
jgi:hypothetical protein